MSDIEFSVFIEKRFLYVFLDDETSVTSIVAFLSAFYSYVDVVERIAYAYAFAPVWVFSWFDNPHIFFLRTILFLQRFKSAMTEQEIFILWIVNSFDQMEGERNIAEDIIAGDRIVFSHKVEECFFIANEIILFKMVVHD